MKKPTNSPARAGVSIALALLFAGCASSPAPDFWGLWRPVNRYADQPVSIPLRQQYLFYASPLDGTLKTMLTRWAQDTSMTLSYQHPFDFTLHTVVSDIRTADIGTAAQQLSQAYASQQVLVTVEGNQLVVRAHPAGSASADTDRAGVARDAGDAGAGSR